jgi:glycosyltransferase involved in cell wall biosynthesis
MKILFLFPHFLSPGGAANSTVRFARALKEKGHTVEIVCARVSDDFLEENKDLKVTMLNIPHSGTLRYWAFFPLWQRKINKTLLKYEDYIFFPQVFPANWWAWIFKFFYKDKKIIWNCNEPSAFIHSEKWVSSIRNPFMRLGAIMCNPFLKKVDIFLEKKNDFVFCNSSHSFKDYKKSYGRDADYIIFPPSYIKNIALSNNKKNYFLSVGHLSKFKNIDFLVKSFEKISKKFSQYSLIIAGDGGERYELEKLTKKKGLGTHIKFLGKVSEEKLADLYMNARATIICSKNEPFGLVPVESMMYGTPVIAHKSGGPLETIIENKTGFLYDQDSDLPKFIEEIILLEKSDYNNMQYASQAQARNFDISISIAKIEKSLNFFSE